MLLSLIVWGIAAIPAPDPGTPPSAEPSAAEPPASTSTGVPITSPAARPFEEPADAARWRRIRTGAMWVGGGSVVVVAMSGASLTVQDGYPSNQAFAAGIGGMITGGLGLAGATAVVGIAAGRAGWALNAVCPHPTAAGTIAFASTVVTGTTAILQAVAYPLVGVTVAGIPTIWISSAVQGHQDRRALAECGVRRGISWQLMPTFEQPGLQLVGQF